MIASLTLMMLLGLIAVGVLSIAATQNRLAGYAALQMEARQQALIGLDAALAEMQMELGPDQRVTASSGILSESAETPQHILGVWDSWQQPLYSKNDQGIASTYSKGRSSKFRRWLISCRDPQMLSQMDSVQALCKRNPETRICLVGEGTLGRSANSNDYIYADLVEMPSGGNNIANFAWWVSGENQKAIATLTAREESTDVVETLRRTWDTPPPAFTDHPTLSFIDTLTPEEKKKALSMKTLAHTRDYIDGVPGFYDVTLYSQSLPINVRDGGFKYDLNLLLSKEKLDNTVFAARSDQDCPLAEDKEIPTGTEPNLPIGSWQVMHAWYNTWPDGTSKETSGFHSRLQGNMQRAWTTMSGDLVDATTSGGDQVTYFDDRARGTKSAGYARVPILTTFLSCWGLSAGPSIYTSKGGTIRYLYSPMIMWWNPYNVQMRVGAKKMWMYSLPYRTQNVQMWLDRALMSHPDVKPLDGPLSPWGPQSLLVPTGKKDSEGQKIPRIPWQCIFHVDWGNYFVNSEEDQSSDIVFEPGEILAFTMAGDVVSLNEMDGLEVPASMPFVVGDQPDEMTNYSMDFQDYVNLFDPSAASYRNMYVDLFSAKLKFEHKNTPFFSGSLGSGLGDRLGQVKWQATMGEVLMSDAHYRDFMDHEHVVGREAFSVVYGYDGLYVPNTGTLEEKCERGKVDSFYGVKGISPASFNLGWYDYETDPENGMLFLDTRWNADMYGTKPTYYVAVGIVPKSYNESLNEGFPMFKGKDYRTKTWQHSSPALWGSALYKPDDQQRQYHPYQLAAIELGAGINRGPLDTVNGRNGVHGLFSAGVGGGENVSFLSVLELPYHPPFSLAGFAGMRLTPGWYKESKSVPGNAESIARMRRMQYQAGVPGVGIGNSFADPCLAADEVYAFHENNANLSAVLRSTSFSDYYDHGLLINDALWDRWFCSSVSDMPHKSSGRIPASQTLTAFMEEDEPLPVSRYKKNLNGLKKEQVIERIMSNEGWQHIARYLVIEGGFNINSISEDAWAATLQGLARRELVSNGGTANKLRKIDKPDRDVLFSRFMVSTSSRPIDRNYSPLDGSTSLRPSLKMAAAWGEVRSLSPEEIRELAREIVKVVRERGPFLNMSDFINRRLDGGSDSSLTGALQAAIDATDINQPFKDEAYNVTVQKSGSLYKYQKAAEGSMYTAAPGYLIQSDVLSSLGNILTVRDDTFTVRAYGSVRNARRAVLAQAWCEATVQRTIDYMDPDANTPEDNDRTDELSQKVKGSQKLSEINRTMGRKLKVISFRWLDSWDI